MHAVPALSTIPHLRICTPAGVALFADSSRGGLALFGPGSKPGSAVEGSPGGWRGVFTGDFPVGQTICFVEGYYALPFILQVSGSVRDSPGCSGPVGGVLCCA